MPARPKSDKIWADAIRRAVHAYYSEKGPDGKTKKTRWLNVLANQLVKHGMAGDVLALREIGDRLDGKATQRVEGEVKHVGVPSADTLPDEAWEQEHGGEPRVH